MAYEVLGLLSLFPGTGSPCQFRPWILGIRDESLPICHPRALSKMQIFETPSAKKKIALVLRYHLLGFSYRVVRANWASRANPPQQAITNSEFHCVIFAFRSSLFISWKCRVSAEAQRFFPFLKLLDLWILMPQLCSLFIYIHFMVFLWKWGLRERSSPRFKFHKYWNPRW